jgi:5'(3')-deoxyribonucleotidase
VARIAIDIDSTLHHYWDLLDRVAQERFGIALPYAEQRTWGITLLDQEQLVECIRETHSEPNIVDSEPYPRAVETVAEWSRAGHWIHITSHRATGTHAATVRWLDRIGLPWDDLHCSYDKVTRCVELGIDVLVDDSPVNLERAADEGILGATLIHPWNENVIDGDRVVGARDWDELRAALAPALRRAA